MNTFVQKGEKLDYTAGADVASGEIVIIRSGTTGACGIAVADIANGAVGEIMTNGVHKVTTEVGAWTFGALLYRHATNKTATTSATGNTLLGYAAAAKTSAATTGYIMLNAQAAG